jgi:hypothetical protein
VTPGGTLNASVATTGAVSRVEVFIGSGDPTAPAPTSFELTSSGPGAWTGTGSAPATAGQYHFTVGLFDPAGHRTIADNDGWNLTVASPQPTAPAPTAPAVQPLPADIPLAPPFSYGNPVPAVFSAAGASISGAEVVSTTRPDVAPDVVLQFYVVRLPRAGWTVDQSTVPAPGATSFSISASKPGAAGTLVCVVDYSSSTLYIFYGSTTG